MRQILWVLLVVIPATTPALGNNTTESLTTQVSPAGAGMVTVTPSLVSYAPGTVVTITASANSGYSFSNWSLTTAGQGGSISDASSVSTSLTIPQGGSTVTANFTSTLSITAYTPTTWVHQNAPATTKDRHVVALTTSVTTDTWSNNNHTATQSGPGVVASTNAASSPVFGRVTESLYTQVSPSGAGIVTVTSTQTQPPGYIPLSVVGITASANPGYTFSNWTLTTAGQGGLISSVSSSSTSLTIPQGGSTLTAFFTPSLSITAYTSTTWVYQNTPATTKDRHVVALTVRVTTDTWSNNNYTVTVTLAGSGVVTPTQTWTSGTLVAPTATASWTVSAGNDLSGYLVGGRVNGPVTGTANMNLTGSCAVAVTVVGDVGGSATATVTITVRPLGDIDGSGLVDRNDLAILNNRLNAFAIAPQTDADCELSGDGHVTAADRVLLNRILNDLPVP